MKYMVMECHLSYAIVLAEDGRFLKVANLHYQVGEIVYDVVEMNMPTPKHHMPHIPKWGYALSALACCLVLALTSFLWPTSSPYASVYLSINPEVRIDVDSQDQVVDLEGVNEDGIALLENYTYQDKNLDLVMDELVDRAIEMGYLTEGGTVSLVLDADDNQWVVDHQTTLSDHLHAHLDQKISVVIEIKSARDASQQVTIPVEPVETPVEPEPPVVSEPVDEEVVETPRVEDGDSQYSPSDDDDDDSFDDGDSNYDDADEDDDDADEDDDDD